MADTGDKSGDRKKTKLRMDVLDRMECYQIICEVFFDYIPDDQKLLAMAQAAERINYEVKDCESTDE